MEPKWSQDPEKQPKEFILDAMKALAQKVSKKSQDPGPGKSRELGWVPLIKGTTESQESYKPSIGGIGIVQGIMKRPLVPTVADPGAALYFTIRN